MRTIKFLLFFLSIVYGLFPTFGYGTPRHIQKSTFLSEPPIRDSIDKKTPNTIVRRHLTVFPPEYNPFQISDLKSSSIYIVYHVGILNNWQEVMEEQLKALTSSGLLEACTEFVVCFVGDDTPIIYNLLENIPYTEKTKIIHGSEDLLVCEFPSIALTKEVARNHRDAKILYLHNKGVTHFNTPKESFIRDWRLHIEYFLIHHWQTCIDALDAYDICGVNWFPTVPNYPQHFSGNFWWARADYVQTIPELPKPYLFKNRCDCEWFIGTGHLDLNKVKSFHQSGCGGFHYFNPYPREKYAYD